MDGVIHGGWEFVIGAYSVTAVVFFSYVTSVLLRARDEDRKAKGTR